jgi:hypothetical protein
MPTTITITAGNITRTAELDDTPTARKLLAALPITARAQRWGQEIYFTIPVSAEQEPAARTEMAVGEVAYWPPGGALCIFFGRTPASDSDAPVAASPVNVVGRIVGDALAFDGVKDGTTVRVEAAGK